VTVAAGIDDSPVSGLVVARAIEQARWRQSDFHIVHVTYMPVVHTDTAIDWDEVAKAQRESAWAGVNYAIDSADLMIERVDLEGYPPDTLVMYAANVPAGYI